MMKKCLTYSTKAYHKKACQFKYPKIIQHLERETGKNSWPFTNPPPLTIVHASEPPIGSNQPLQKLKNQRLCQPDDRPAILAMISRLGLDVGRGWPKLRGFRRPADVANGIKSIDGMGVDENAVKRQRNATRSWRHALHLTVALFIPTSGFHTPWFATAFKKKSYRMPRLLAARTFIN